MGHTLGANCTSATLRDILDLRRCPLRKKGVAAVRNRKIDLLVGKLGATALTLDRTMLFKDKMIVQYLTVRVRVGCGLPLSVAAFRPDLTNVDDQPDLIAGHFDCRGNVTRSHQKLLVKTEAPIAISESYAGSSVRFRALSPFCWRAIAARASVNGPAAEQSPPPVSLRCEGREEEGKG